MSWPAIKHARAVLARTELRAIGTVERFVYKVLAEYYGDSAYPSIETVAGQVGKSTRHCQRALDKLEKVHRLIVRDKKGGRGNQGIRYQFPGLEKDDTQMTPFKPEKDDAQMSPFDAVKGDILTPERVTFEAIKGDISGIALKEEQKRTSTKNAPPVSAEPTDDPPIAARVLSEACGNFNLRFQAERALQIKAEATKRGISAKAAAEFMLSQWELYNSSRTKLSYPVMSAERFWSSGIWHDSTLWQLKEGATPITDPPRRKYDSVEDKLAQLVGGPREVA